MKTPAIILEQGHKNYPGGVLALDGVNICIERGEWVAIMGPSGSGKTTLLNVLGGLDRLSSGCLKILDVDITQFYSDEAATFRRENIGLVFQQHHLIPYLSALENVMLAQYYHSLVDKKQAQKALERVQLAERAHHLPSQLSGGEQQRVCIARALINEPKIILADEPTGNLDEVNEGKVLEILGELQKDGKTLLVVTHDREVGSAAQRIVTLKHGRVVQETKNNH